MGFLDNLGRIGDNSELASGLVTVTKKEIQVSNQDSRDYSTVSTRTNTDSRSFSTVNAPTLVFNSAGAEVTGASSSFSPSTSVSPEVTTKKESSLSAEQSQTSGSMTSLLIVGGLVAGGYFIIKGGVKVAKKTPQGKVLNKVMGGKK